MTTSSILLTPGQAIFPDGSASNTFPALQRVKSSGAAPGIYFLQLAFDTTTVEWVTFAFRMPVNYASAPVAKIVYKMASATSGGVAWDVRVAAVSDGDATDVDAKVFAAANIGTATVPGTAGFMDEVSVTLSTADSLAANDLVVLYLGRATGNAGDTATGDAEFLAMTLEYTTT